MSFLSSYQRARILLLAGAIICFALFWWTGGIFRIPVHPGYEASLLLQPNALLALIVIFLVLMLSVAIGTAIAGMVRFNSGLLVASLGLLALSFRGGTSRDTIFWGLSRVQPQRIFLILAAETIILAAMIAACWWVLRTLYSTGRLRDRESELLPPLEPAAGEEWPALGIQAIITGAGILLLAPTAAKHQVLAALAISCFSGAAVAQLYRPSNSLGWYWAPPLLVGTAGYLLVSNTPAGAAIADPQGFFAPLARPLPLDYASIGTATAIAGYWMGRRWHREKHEAGDANTSPAAGS